MLATCGATVFRPPRSQRREAEMRQGWRKGVHDVFPIAWRVPFTLPVPLVILRRAPGSVAA